VVLGEVEARGLVRSGFEFGFGMMRRELARRCFGLDGVGENTTCMIRLSLFFLVWSSLVVSCMVDSYWALRVLTVGPDCLSVVAYARAFTPATRVRSRSLYQVSLCGNPLDARDINDESTSPSRPTCGTYIELGRFCALSTDNFSG